jgi:dienelactone hydrolase
MPRFLLTAIVILLPPALRAADPDLGKILARPVIGPRHSVHEVIEYCDARIPAVPVPKDAKEWEAYSAKVRADVLANVVFRGEAARWRDYRGKVEKLGPLPAGEGYRLTKLRYEALPGLWIPALLYEPAKLEGKVPVVLNVNGHEGIGKAAPYKQVRCVNLARKGLIALNVEWLGMGQLRSDGFSHARMNQLDLCGTSGLAPFYLNMTRGLDVLLAHPHADPKRVAVTGLSGGGWQTIIVSSLDTRVTLSNPVAGYSSFRTRARHPKDLGDSEQTPTDLAVYADYATLTAMMAPRPTLLTNNATDNCCFEAGYTLPPLLRAAGPIFQVFGKPGHLRTHVNHDPGDHNYGKDNREAFYRMVGDFFFDGKFDAKEIPSDDEAKKPAELMIDLPVGNRSFNVLALELSERLPETPAPPSDRAALEKWQANLRTKLRDVVRWREFAVKPEPQGSESAGDVRVTYRRLRIGTDWTVPAVELVRGKPKGTAMLVADEGRGNVAARADELLKAGYRVVAVDPLNVGEAKMIHPGGDAREPKFGHDDLYAMLLATVGDRLLGLQASQLAAVARWASAEFGGPVMLVGVGPRVSLAVLVAAALEEKAIGSVEVTGERGSLKEVIEENRSYQQMPEVFCLGLLEAVDLKHLAALSAPRPVRVVHASERAKAEFAVLKAVYAAFEKEFDPLK